MSFNFKIREKFLNSIESSVFDLVIIGGGITGAGVARDAASRGMRVVLVEAEDFASGTSSRSSKLIHGGLRYLENLEFHLVFEALSERRILLEMAPHLVHPLKFYIPLYKNSRVGMFKLGLGMWLYDLLSQFEAPELHQKYEVEQAIKEVPILNQKNLVGAFSYYDAYMDDDRLVYETLRSAHLNGALPINYVKAGKAIFENEKMVAVSATDKLGNKEYLIKGKHFLSATGPWTDSVGSGLLSDWKKILRPTKGIHLTISKARLPIKDAVVLSDDAKKRIVFVIPRFDMVIVGTTDTDYSGDPANVTTETEDVVYLLGLLSEYFPGAKLTREDLIASYAGVRPLVYDGAATEGKTSREHTIISDRRNITFVAGGKYTTYRKMSQEITDRIISSFTFDEQMSFRQPSTKGPLNPFVDSNYFSDLITRTTMLANEHGRTVEEMDFLLRRHGAEAFDILAKYGRDRTVWELEAFHAIYETMCMNITDFMTRRVPLFLGKPDHGSEVLNQIEQVFMDCFKLSKAEISAQTKNYVEYQRRNLRWKLN